VQVRRIVVLLAAAAAAAVACTNTVIYLGPRPPPYSGRATLGIEPAEIPHAGGARVAEVLPGGPAEAAGVKKNDVVVRVGIKQIANSCDLVDAAFDRRTCDAVSLGIVRDGKPMELVVTPVDQAMFFKKSCAAGNLNGCFRLGWLTLSGNGVPRDEEKGMQIYADACARGAAEACAYRGLNLIDDSDAKPDDVVATPTRACGVGCASGCENLAFLY